MNRKAVSIIILCLMLFSTLPLSFHSTGGENEKSAKAPKAPGGEVSDVKIVYNDTYKTINYTCWTSGTPSYSKWNGTTYNDLNTVKNAGVIRRNTTFNVTATGISSANKIKVLGPCDVGEPRPNITTWSPQYDSTPDPDVWNFTVPSNAPVGDYQLYLNESYCTVYVIFDVFLTKTPSGMNDTEFSSWGYNESNDASLYGRTFYPTANAMAYYWPFTERTTELAVSIMGGSTTTEYKAAINGYRLSNARIVWDGVSAGLNNVTNISNTGTGLTISEGKKVALQTGHTLPAGMVIDGQCTVFSTFYVGLCRSIGIPARDINAYDTAGVGPWGWNYHNWAECYIENPDMSLSPTNKKWLLFDATDTMTSTSQNSNGEASIDTTHDYYFHSLKLDLAVTSAGNAAVLGTVAYLWNGGTPSVYTSWGTVNVAPNYTCDESDLPNIDLTSVDYGYFKGELGAGDRDFFNVTVTGLSSVDIGFIEGAAYAQIYVNNTTTTGSTDFAPNSALKTAYYSSLVWGDDTCVVTVPSGVNYLYIMVDNAKEFKYANDYAKDPEDTSNDADAVHGMAETHHYKLGVGKCPPNVEVKSPNGNEVLIAGKTYNITWNATIINSSRLATNCINISYSTDGGENWNTIDGAQGLSNTGYYTWSVPTNVNSDNVKINITCNTTDNKEGYDVSDNSFTIRGSTPFRELSSGSGNAAGDRFGWNVSYAGDLNGDGVDDIVVGAPYVTYNSVSECGAVYIFFGYSGISTGNLTATYANVSIYGTIADGHFGWSVSDAGDVNGTYDDVIIGAPDTTNGNAYIFCGWTLTNDPDGILTADDADVNISGGSSGDKFGFSVSGAGDVNNDTYDDVIIGAYANGTDKGKAYIFYGASTGPSQINYTACTENYNITGTTTNFPYMRNWADSEANATLSEAAVANDLATIFSERFPVAAAPWTGTGQDQSWNVVTVSEAADIAIKSGEATGSAVSGDPVLWMEDCDDAWGVGDIVWASVDLSGYSSVVIEYYWQLYLVDAGEGFRSAYSTDATGGTDALGTWNLMYEHLDAPESVWTKDTFNLPDSACVANFKFRFNAYATGPGEETYIDDVKITGVPVGLTNRTEIQVNTTSIPSGKNTYTLEIYGNRSDEKFNISVYNGTNWNVRGNISSATMTLFTYTLLSGEIISNEVKMKFIDENRTGDATASSVYIDYLRIKAVAAGDVTLSGENDNDKFGFSVSDAGNVNGDNCSDVIVGAPGYDSGRGKAYVVYGNSSLFSEYEYDVEKNLMTQDFSSAVPPTGWTEELNGGDWASSATTTAGGTSPEAKFTYAAGTGPSRIYSGNIDTTGYTSLKLTFKHMVDWYANPNIVGVETRASSSDTWVTVWSISPGGNVGARTETVIIDNPHVGSSTFQIGWFVGVNTNNVDYWYVDDIFLNGTVEADVTRTGESSNNNFGYSVSAAGDVNNDGYDDFAVGAPGYDNSKGRAYVYYGSPCMQSTDIVTITQQPGDNGDHWVGKDNWLFSGDVYYTAAINSNLGVGYRDAAGYYKMRSPIQFDLSFIPSDAVVVNASLKLCAKSSGGGLPFKVEVHRITNSWKEGTGEGQNTAALDGVTWNNRTFTILWDTAGGDFEQANVSVTVSEATDKWYSWGITSLCQGWVNGSYTNYGMMIKAEKSIEDTTAATKDVYFYASDNATKHDLAPKLEIKIRKNADLTISGDKTDDKFGYSVSGRDLNNDSFSDIIVGAPYKDNGTSTKAGAVYVFFGNTTMPSATNASHADNETFGNETNLTLGFSVSYADLNKDGYNDIIAGAYNYSSNQGKVYALTCRRATLTVSNWTKNETTTVNVGTNDVLMLNMTLTASECTIRVTNIRVNLTGTGGDTNVSACRLFHDANDNGTYEAGEDVFLGNQTFSGGSLNFTNLSFDVAYGIPEKLLLLFNITNSAAAVGHYVGANLTDYSFISVARPDNVSNYNFPIQSTNMKITSGVAADALNVTVKGTPIAPEFVNQESTNRTMLNLTLNSSNADNGQVTIMSINISLTGTGIGAGDNANVSNVTIYNDTNKDGTLSAGDTQLNTTQIFSGGYVLFGNLNFDVYYADGNYTIFVVYNISSSATINATVGANVTDETKITVGSSDSVDAFSTIWSNNSTIIEPAPLNYTIRNETGVLQEGTWKVWGNWTADPNATKVNGTNWLRIRNTNCSNNAQQFVVDFSNTSFNQTTGSGTIPIDGNITFWFFFTNSSSDTNATWTGARYNTTNLTTGSYTFTFNKVGEYIWIVYRMEGIPDILPDGDYTASFTVTAV